MLPSHSPSAALQRTTTSCTKALHMSGALVSMPEVPDFLATARRMSLNHLALVARVGSTSGSHKTVVIEEMVLGRLQLHKQQITAHSPVFL